MNIELPGSVALIIRELEGNGHEAYAVGGCVRDAVMGRIPHDWDITTSAKPEEVKAIFHKTIDTGIKHGTVTVMISKVGYEVTTFRVDGKYEDGRHPKEVQFTGNLKKDLERRDFTINAMAYSDRTGIVDEFDGITDLNNKIIRCVGNATERFTEDALRILRAVRFSAQLDFDIEDETYEAVKELRETLEKISRERIRTELEKLLESGHAEKISLLYETGLIDVIFDAGIFDIKGYFTKEDAFKEYCNKVGRVRNDRYLRWAAFLYMTGDHVHTLLKGLKFDNKTIDIVTKLVINGDTLPKAEPEHVRRHMCKVGKDIYELYLEYAETVLNRNVADIRKIYNEIITNNDCLSIRELDIKGADLKEMGIEPGKEMGIVLEELFERVLAEPKLNKKDSLSALAEEIKKQKIKM